MVDHGDEKPTSMVTGDSGPGTGLADILPIPTSVKPVTEPEGRETFDSLHQDGTLSHALATDDHEHKGAAQQAHGNAEVRDLGWNEDKEHIARPLVGGMDNEELWLLVRRFNKQMYHVKAVTYPVPGDLDLNIAEEDEFSPDKLRAHLERMYTTVIVGLFGAVKHIARLRSWRETRRTSVFCAAYFLAWTFDFIVPLLAVTVLTLITVPRSRGILFPPAPLALVDSKSGGVQKPKSGVLASHDSVTGAPENHKGEAVEQEASNFVSSIASVAISSAAGKHPSEDQDNNEPLPDSAPEPSAMAGDMQDAKEVASGAKPEAGKDKTKMPMEEATWSKMRPIMHQIVDLTDTWERFANALSPTPPFPKETARLRIASMIVPILGLSLFVTSYMYMKGLTLGIGFGFFGDPIISRGLDWLNRTIPNWQKLLELRNTVLKGVPTNAQLTITLLRIGEANDAPLPPPPRTDNVPEDKPANITDNDLRATGAEPPLNATQEELDIAVQNDPSVQNKMGGSNNDAAKDKKHDKKGGKILGFFKGLTKGGVNTALTADTAKAKLGSHHAKDRLGAVPSPGADLRSGPVDFKARFEGHKGHVYISTKATPAAVAFSTDSTIEKIGSQAREDLHPKWSLAVRDIQELKKIGGFGWKAKLIVGWSLGRQVADGLEITTVDGQSFKITACPLRDELFNRLVAMGGQKWEAW